MTQWRWDGEVLTDEQAQYLTAVRDFFKRLPTGDRVPAFTLCLDDPIPLPEKPPYDPRDWL